MWSAGGGAGNGSACGSSGMDLKHEVAYRGVLPGQVKAEPGVSHNGHPPNGHIRDWMAGGAGSPSPGAASQPQPNNGYSSPLSSSSYGPYSPNGKIGESIFYIKLSSSIVLVSLPKTSKQKDENEMIRGFFVSHEPDSCSNNFCLN